MILLHTYKTKKSNQTKSPTLIITPFSKSRHICMPAQGKLQNNNKHNG